MVRVLFQILVGGGTESEREDRMMTGFDNIKSKDGLGFFSESFLLFRGAAMKDDSIREWKRHVGKRSADKSSQEAIGIAINTFINTSKSLLYAVK